MSYRCNAGANPATSIRLAVTRKELIRGLQRAFKFINERCVMNQWNFDKPDETNPGDHVFALVIYKRANDIGVCCLERAHVRREWNSHVFAWQPIAYPVVNVCDLGEVVDAWRARAMPQPMDGHNA